MYNFIDLQDTIVALATPAGSGAIGIVRLSGNQAISITNEVFQAKDLQQVDSHTIHLGYIRDEQNKIIDQALVSVFKNPHSYTKEDVIEVSCHGSRYIQQQLIELFIRKGARMAREGEFTLRAFLNGQMDLSQAEAVADLIAAESESAHQLALSQMRGGFSDQIKELRSELIHFASMIELELDFGEEDVEFANREKLQELVQQIVRIIKRLLDSFQLGNAIKHGVHTVLAGRPNAGKSTLLNALLNEERAIVSDIAGTTRDTIEEILNIQGVQYRLIDTAGIREATDQIEAIGVEKTLEQVAKSAILIYVYDQTTLSPLEAQADLQKLATADMNIIVVANKADLHSQNQAPSSLEENDTLEKVTQNLTTPYTTLSLSAKDKTQIDQLKQLLFDLVASGQLQQDSSIVSNSRHYEALQSALQSLDAVLEGLEIGISNDFLAMDIRHALNYLGEITGEISTDDLLGNIFSSFCIGK
ncbi:tRNA uridine-5-carboxymethylaminomethyl(34) synthesis GTPase MnmE [Aureispira sp. CCB-E]|uniref:tRNA uridine-5-carboxymethylaminomethyl(34) synthesis GTPase MnmE n=1 Tax=Aureispira sp. CCB-E TaxID=3051121 RepID=UPI0028694646|nr:tRNA uridine-5-carboxymethylaminomethyl(34) synthesis GTPase MnmE [Aureispira sp. CCB-E]WMX16039.1 tRNA uridine-5-carboxymethylaminomethyl(34) synthesis GTPase MnmE [Aureispira sp. CCB-E]